MTKQGALYGCKNHFLRVAITVILVVNLNYRYRLSSSFYALSNDKAGIP